MVKDRLRVKKVCLVVGVQAGLRERVQALRRHHAGDRGQRRRHVTQLRQEERRPEEPDLQITQRTVVM